MKRFQLWLFLVALTGTWSAGGLAAPPQSAAKSADQKPHQIYGTIRAMKGSQLKIETRDKRMVAVDAETAMKTYRSALLGVGGSVLVQGPMDAKGVLHAETIQRAKSSPAAWGADR
jgi:hypothetical protein